VTLHNKRLTIFNMLIYRLACCSSFSWSHPCSCWTTWASGSFPTPSRRQWPLLWSSWSPSWTPASTRWSICVSTRPWVRKSAIWQAVSIIMEEERRRWARRLIWRLSRLINQVECPRLGFDEKNVNKRVI